MFDIGLAYTMSRSWRGQTSIKGGDIIPPVHAICMGITETPPLYVSHTLPPFLPQPPRPPSLLNRFPFSSSTPKRSLSPLCIPSFHQNKIKKLSYITCILTFHSLALVCDSFCIPVRAHSYSTTSSSSPAQPSPEVIQSSSQSPLSLLFHSQPCPPPRTRPAPPSPPSATTRDSTAPP